MKKRVLQWLLNWVQRILSRYVQFYTVRVIEPYYDFENGNWAFDDPIAGLKREAFHLGIGTIIETLTQNFQEPEQGGWRLHFSSIPFPGYQVTLKALGYENGGVWYECQELKVNGWLCEQIYKYFQIAPQYIYVRVEEKPKI